MNKIISDAGKICFLKHGQVFYDKFNFDLFENPITFLILVDNGEYVEVSPMFYGNPEDEKNSFNGYTVRDPFINIESLPDKYRFLNIQINKKYSIKRNFVDVDNNYQLRIGELKILLEGISDFKSVPERIKNLDKAVVEITEYNERISKVFAGVENTVVPGHAFEGIAASIRRFINNTKISNDNVLFYEYSKTAASCDNRKINTKVNNTEVRGEIKIKISEETFEPVLSIYIHVHFMEPVTVWIKLVIDDVETEEFEIGYVDSGVVEKELSSEQIPNIKKDSTISGYVLGFK